VNLNYRDRSSICSIFPQTMQYFRELHHRFPRGRFPADQQRGLIHPCRTAARRSTSETCGLRSGAGGPSSATTRSRSVTNTVSPPSANRASGGCPDRTEALNGAPTPTLGRAKRRSPLPPRAQAGRIGSGSTANLCRDLGLSAHPIALTEAERSPSIPLTRKNERRRMIAHCRSWNFRLTEESPAYFAFYPAVS